MPPDVPQEAWVIRKPVLLVGATVVWALATSLALQAWSVSAFERGQDAYKAGNYAYAAKYFAQAAAEQPQSDSLSQFYLGLSLARLNQFAGARDAFERVVENESLKNAYGRKGDEALLAKARRNIAVITKSQMTAAGKTASQTRALVNETAGKNDNYLVSAIPRGEVIHWDPAKMPIKVAVESGQGVPGWKPAYNACALQAMSVWERASGGVIRFVSVRNPQDADIRVSWTTVFQHNQVGVNYFQQVGRAIARADVHVATTHPAGRRLTLEEIRGTMIHEFGHALGLQGHSPYPGDIMYFAQNPVQGSTLSARDEKTIRLLYAQRADVTNRAGASVSQTRQAYSLARQAAPLITRDPDRAAALLAQAVRLDPANEQFQKMWASAQFNQGVNALNAGVEAGQAQDRPRARRLFQRARELFETVSRSPYAPPETRKNLVAARQNEAIVSQDGGP